MKNSIFIIEKAKNGWSLLIQEDQEDLRYFNNMMEQLSDILDKSQGKGINETLKELLNEKNISTDNKKPKGLHVFTTLKDLHQFMDYHFNF